ncbi:unnamed protein product [Ranitomeya imitator]|uniref:Uncharacterized protein n=1 Tax=Ranitomeya imitator TaxID=111125 RepID=A0ABN9KRS6_9NEOB|nr:unnamed protein product [Ranitomeya imitator]
MSTTGFPYNESEIAEIVSQVMTSGDFLQISASEFKSRDLERETRHLVGLELHSITIAEYIKTQRIPRGLRVSLRPTLFQDNPEFCQKFELILNKCSLDLMALTLDNLNKEIKNCQDKVSSIETQLKDSLPKEEFEAIKTCTKDNVDSFKKDTEQRKRQKFIRDTQDYLQKRVYKWQGSSSRQNYRSYRNMDGTSASSSDSERLDYVRSTSSSSFLGSSKRTYPRKGRGRGPMLQRSTDKGCIPGPRSFHDASSFFTTAYLLDSSEDRLLYRLLLLPSLKSLGLPVHRLKCDVATRWNSTLHMLQRLWQHRRVLVQYVMTYSLGQRDQEVDYRMFSHCGKSFGPRHKKSSRQLFPLLALVHDECDAHHVTKQHIEYL